MATQLRVPGFRVERLLGVGASGDVWLATVRSTGAGVALKRVPIADPARRREALAEAARLSALDHPNLVRLHRVVRVEGAVVLVLDLAAAGSLAGLLAARGRLAAGEVISALSPVAAALAHAHAAGVVHGDVTPANVLFTEIGLPLLADLGVSRLVGDDVPVRTTAAYADPAVVAGDQPAPDSDVYMLGAVAMHALTGTPPPSFGSDEEFETADQAQWRAQLAGRLTAATVPALLQGVVLRALCLDADARGTAADFALDLRWSGTPTAVELTAGRVRVEPSLRRARLDRSPDRGGHSPRHAAPVGVPDPVPDAPPADSLPLTRGVRAHSPLAAPARGPRRVRRYLLPVAVLAVAAVLVGVGLAWWPAGAPDRHDRATGARRLPPDPGASTAPVAATTPSGRASALDASQAAHILRALDEHRSAAFGTGDPDQLRGVYGSPVLLARDAAALRSAVPPGCGLYGLRTSFADVAVLDRTATSVWVSTRATLAGSSLACAGRPAGRAAGAGPVRLRIELTATSAGYRITALRRD